MRKSMTVLALALISSYANAQQWSDVMAVNPEGYVSSPLDGQPIASLNPDVLMNGCNAVQTSCATVGVNIQDFAETSYVNGQFANLNNEFAGVNAQLAAITTTINGLSTQVSRLSTGLDHVNQLAVAAAAMKDAIPNDGDRFAFRINMAAAHGAAAGSLGFSANLTQSVRFSADYARSGSQNVVGGGINVSLH